MDADTAKVVAALYTNAIVGVVVTVLFQLFRNHNLEVYAPRLRYLKQTIAAPAKGYFALLHQLTWTDDSELLHSIGMDAYVFLRFLKMCCKLGICCTVPAFCLLLPVYGTGEGNDGVEGINLVSMANLKPYSPRLWASLFAIYYFTLTFLYLVHKEYEHFMVCRNRFFKEGDPNIHEQMNYSVIVENIPKEYCTAEGLMNFMAKVVPEKEIHSASVAVRMGPLIAAVKERSAALVRLEGKIAAYEGDATVPEKKRPLMKLNKKGKPALCCGIEADAVGWWSARVEALSAKVRFLQCYVGAVENGNVPDEFAVKDMKKSEAKVDIEEGTESTDRQPLLDQDEEKALDKALKTVQSTGTGFLTLFSRKVQASVSLVPVLFEEFPEVKVAVAPQPEDIIWSNMPATLSGIATSVLITSAFLYAGLAFWGLILALIAAISTLSNLATFLPFITLLDPTLLAIIGALLPVVVLNIFVSLIPTIIGAVATYVEHQKTKSAVELQVFSWFFLYQLANIFLIVLSGSIFNSLADFIANPLSIVALLGKAVPATSTFFMTFVIASILAGIPMMYLRLVPLIIFRLYSGCLNQNKLTRADIVEGALAKANINHGATLPILQYILLILLVFWAIAPVLLALCTIYFCASYLAYKYQFMFVFVRRFESGGKFWYGLHNYMMISLMATTILSIVFMAIKQGIPQTILLAPLPLIIMGVRRYTESAFKDMSMYMPYSAAVKIDATKEDELAKDDVSDTTMWFSPSFYKPEEYTAAKIVYPYPYRINNEPLLTDTLLVSLVYRDGMSEGEPDRRSTSLVVRDEKEGDRVNLDDWQAK